MNIWLAYVDHGSEGHRFVGVFDSEVKAYAAIGMANHSRDSMKIKGIELNKLDEEYGICDVLKNKCSCIICQRVDKMLDNGWNSGFIEQWLDEGLMLEGNEKDAQAQYQKHFTNEFIDKAYMAWVNK